MEAGHDRRFGRRDRKVHPLKRQLKALTSTRWQFFPRLGLVNTSGYGLDFKNYTIHTHAHKGGQRCMMRGRTGHLPIYPYLWLLGHLPIYLYPYLWLLGHHVTMFIIHAILSVAFEPFRHGHHGCGGLVREPALRGHLRWCVCGYTHGRGKFRWAHARRHSHHWHKARKEIPSIYVCMPPFSD